jgi:hypothetical protein
VLFGEDAVEERSFAGAEEAGEDGDGNGHGEIFDCGMAIFDFGRAVADSGGDGRLRAG